jgi:hypothetical protein
VLDLAVAQITLYSVVVAGKRQIVAEREWDCPDFVEG